MPCVLLTELKTGEPQKGALILSSLISVWCKVTPSQAHLMHPRADEPQEERQAPGQSSCAHTCSCSTGLHVHITNSKIK